MLWPLLGDASEQARLNPVILHAPLVLAVCCKPSVSVVVVVEVGTSYMYETKATACLLLLSCWNRRESKAVLTLKVPTKGQSARLWRPTTKADFTILSKAMRSLVVHCYRAISRLRMHTELQATLLRKSHASATSPLLEWKPAGFSEM